MYKSLARPLLALVALAAVLPLGGCLAATVGSIAASALLSAAGGGGPEQLPTVAEQLATTDGRVRDSCRARLDPAPGDTVRQTSAAPQQVSAHPEADASPRCGVRPVCLPGHSQPTMMMVCRSDATPGTAQTDTDPATRRYEGWDWAPFDAHGTVGESAAQPARRNASEPPHTPAAG